MVTYVKNSDVRYQYAQCKLLVEAGKYYVAEDCVQTLRGHWNHVIDGTVDVQDVDFLYNRLVQCIKMVTLARAGEYDYLHQLKKRMDGIKHPDDI